MDKINNLIEHVRSVKSELRYIVEQALRANEDLLIEMVRDEQLYEEGINGIGIKIDSYLPYAPSTVRRKKAKNQPTNRVTLRDTGDFYKGFFVEFTSDGFRVTSSDYKAEHLEDKYGNSIFVLTGENKLKVTTRFIRPEVLKKLKQ